MKVLANLVQREVLKQEFLPDLSLWECQLFIHLPVQTSALWNYPSFGFWGKLKCQLFLFLFFKTTLFSAAS